MDCDDNDFQNQNFQLIGEDNDGFPQSLQSYDPPKFEIEDHFHSHLRFDTLAETGLFLGIQGEENNWIEEFSPRNSAVEFGSSASQTCSISVHDNLWPNAPSSESSQMLVKSVGDDEISPRVMNTGAEAHAIEDSSRSEIKGVADTDSTHSPDKLHNSSLGSNDVIVRAEEHVVSAETSEAVLEVSSLDQKIHPAGKVVALQLNVTEELTSSSSGVSKSCLVSGELLDVIQRKEPPDHSSTRNSSLDDCGFTVDKGTELSSNILSCNSQDDSLLPSTENAGIRTGKDNLSFTEPNMDVNKRSEALQSEDKQRTTSSNLYGDCKLNDHHFQDEALNSHVCATKASSDLVAPIDSLILSNEGSSSTVFSKSSDGLLEAIAYQVKALNKDLKTGDSSSTCINEVPSVTPERDLIVGRKSVDVGTENNPETCDIAGPKDFDHGVQECIPKEDGLNPDSSSTKNGQLICLGEEGDPAASKSVVNDKNSTKLSSSDVEVKVALSSSMESETRMNDVKDSNCCTIDPLSSRSFGTVQTEKKSEAECLKAVTEEPTRNFDASEQTILKEACATFLDTAENKTSSSTHDKVTPISETSSLVPELNENEDNSIPLEKENSAQLIDSSETKSKSCSVGFQNTEVSSSETQNSGMVMDIDKKSVLDRAVAEGVESTSNNNSTDAQQLQPEVEAIVEEKEATMSSIPESHSKEKDAQVSYLSDITSSTVTKKTVVPDSDANCPSVKFSDGLETANNDEVRVDSTPGVSSLATYQSKEDKSVNLAPTNNSEPKFSETKFETLNSGRNNLPQSTLPESNIESCLLEPEGGNLSSYEPNCGSPTVISCNRHTLKEMEHRESDSSLQDPTGPVSETTRNSDNFKGTVQDSRASTASEDDGNFTFVVRPETPKESSKNQELFAKTQSLIQPQVPQESSQECQNETLKESTNNVSRSVEDKKKQVSTRGTRRASISKADAKEKSQEKQGRGRKKNPRSSASPAPDRATRSKTDTEVVQQCLFGGTNTTKSSSSPNIQTSNLPDLNTSAPLLFHQPFTDLQQVQLRAQIFVYGSLIQGVLPDEACMLPAFGGTDGGRSLWEQAWRAASERFHNQKSSAHTSGTHLHYHSEGITCSLLQSKALNSPAGRRDSKVPVSAIQNSTVTLQSPFQISSNDGLPSSISRGTHFDSTQSLSPLQPYPASQIRQYLTSSTPWLSPSPHHASWVFSSQSSPFDSTPQYSAIATTEIAQVTPVRDSAKPRATNVQLASPSPLLANQGAISISTALAVPIVPQNKEATPSSTKNTSLSEKPRKRKKISPPEELLPKFSVSQPQAESAPVPFVTNNTPNSACLSSQGIVTSAGLVPAVSHTATMPYYQVSGNGDSQQRVVFSKETFTQIEHSKMQADNASAYAAAAVRHCQVIWEQMAAQRKSGFASEIEEKLASAAVAASAAASVAKAAAEVAKVASEASLQAKLMADEAINSSNAGNSTQHSPFNLDVGKKLLAPTASVKGKDKVISHSIVFAARETTRKRVEAASAAIKRAENLDAILKAAEMTAEAVSQVGTIIAMGDPVPFSINELLASGPGDHWKLHSMTMKNGIGANVQAKENLGVYVADDHDRFTKQATERPSNHNVRRKPSLVEMPPDNQKSRLLQETYEGHELENGSNTIPTDGLACDLMRGNSIQKGSLVEVVADEEGRRGAWFSALVLDVKDGKAYVCYNDLLSDEGHDKLKEWIPLESESDQPPRIRLAHRVIEAKPEGIRKRRREVAGNITWTVGDRVDAWMRDGWWEGVITDKSEDETKLTVRFTAGGESSIISAWSLRPSLIWKDGQWIEWSRAKERVTLEPYQGDTPYGKRQKLGQVDVMNKPEIGEEGTGAASSNIHTDDAGKLEGTKPLNLSRKDVIFSVGKSVDEENNNDTFKVRRAGLQKDGSKVVFGVPKPGKKRKFMEVSKHYTADKAEKATERSDSLKFAKYLIPQGSQLWRTSSKVDVKGKQSTNLNTKGAKSLRSQNIQAKSTLDKDKSVTTMSVSNRVESNLRTSSSTQEKKNTSEAASFEHVPGKVDITVVESSMQPVPGIPSSKKKPFSLEAEMGEKEKVSPVDQLSGSEVQGSENPGKRFADITEPRRSNRRIQPTSRLLEGLQSSLIISKGPSVPQERGAKTLHKGVSASRGQSHG